MDQTSSIVPSSDSKGTEVVTQSEEIGLANLKESDSSKGKEVVTHSEEITLADLKESDIGKVIYARVYRKWVPTNKQGKPVIFCVVLIDKQGGAIQANVNLREKKVFDAVLQINKTYRITGFGFQPANPWMQVVPHSLSLAFGTCTDIKDTPDVGFPRHYFNFRTHRDLYKKIDVKEGLLTDYIGRVQYVTEIQKSFKATTNPTVWRDIGVQNLDGQTVRFTLWNQDAHNFRKQEYEKAEKPTIIAVSSCLVKEYRGLQLSATYATEYYFNPDIPEYHEIRSVYDEFFDPPAILNVQYERCADPQEERFRNRVTLADLTKEDPQKLQNVRFTVSATIDKIDTTRPWFFKKCWDCKLKISERWPHAQCKQPTSEDELLYSYCFRVELSDGTANVTMTCFSNEANSMVKDCKELLRTIPKQSSYEYPTELLSLQGNKKIFQLHFDPDSTKERQIFILDTCWDETPLLTSGNTITTQSAVHSSAGNTTTKTETSGAFRPKESQITPLAEETLQSTIPVHTPTSITILQTEVTLSPGIEQTDSAPPAEETSLSETSKPKKETARKSARRALFTETEDATTTASIKKSKKEV